MIFDIAGGIQRPLPARSQSKVRPTAEPRKAMQKRWRNEELRKRTRRPQHIRNSVSSSIENFAKVEITSEIRGLRYVAIHVACLLIMFVIGRLAMPSMGHENARHATLLFCAEGDNVRTTGARGGKKIDDDDSKGQVVRSSVHAQRK